MSMDSGLSVLWISKVVHREGMYNIVHTHNYFHFSCTMLTQDTDGTEVRYAPKPLSCATPDTPHGGILFPKGNQSINIMFLVQDKALYKMIDTFPFESVEQGKAHVELLQDIANLCKRKSVDPELINVAVSYYIRLLIHDNSDLVQTEKAASLAEACIAYIDENYMRLITLEDVANHIGKSRNYTSTLFNTAVGMNMTEYLNSVRIKNACALMSYSDMPTEEIALTSGFTNLKHFGRVFKNMVGTSPVRYRTSHMVKDCRYDGEYDGLKQPYRENEEAFTYIVNAQKFVKWKTPYDYILQQPQKND